LWRQLCEPMLRTKELDSEQEEKKSCRKLRVGRQDPQQTAEVEKCKKERQDPAAAQAKNQDKQEWRSCYIAHFWEWKVTDPKLKLRQQRQVKHTHSFLGTSPCQLPHL
jgi:hypothetical protein